MQQKPWVLRLRPEAANKYINAEKKQRLRFQLTFPPHPQAAPTAPKAENGNRNQKLSQGVLDLVNAVLSSQARKWPRKSSILGSLSSLGNTSLSADFFLPHNICCSVTQLCPTLCHPMDCSLASLSFTVSWSLLKLLSTAWVMPSSHLIFCCPLLLLPTVFPSIRVFSSESALCIKWTKYWSFSFSISLPMSIQDRFPLGLTGLISLLSKGLSSLLQYHSLKASVLQCSAFFMVQLSHPYMTTGKTITLIIWTFSGKIIFLLFNTPSRFVIAFLPRSKRLLI